MPNSLDTYAHMATRNDWPSATFDIAEQVLTLQRYAELAAQHRQDPYVVAYLIPAARQACDAITAAVVVAQRDGNATWADIAHSLDIPVSTVRRIHDRSTTA